MENRQVKVKFRNATNYTNKDGKNEWVDAIYKVGVFHTWENYVDGDLSMTKAIVELEDGSVIRCDIDELTFTGKPAGANLFEDGLKEEHIEVDNE